MRKRASKIIRSNFYSSADALKLNIRCIEKMSLYNYRVKLQEPVCCFLDRRLQKFRLRRSSETLQRHGSGLCNHQRSELLLCHSSAIITALSTISPRLSDHYHSELLQRHGSGLCNHHLFK